MLLVTPTASELLVWAVLLDYGQPILIRVWRRGTVFLAVLNKAASSAYSAEDITNFMISEMVIMGPFKAGDGSSLEIKM